MWGNTDLRERIKELELRVELLDLMLETACCEIDTLFDFFRRLKSERYYCSDGKECCEEDATFTGTEETATHRQGEESQTT